MSGETANKKFKRLPESDRTAEYDHTTQRNLEELDAIQNNLDALNEKASAEVLQIEQKYIGLRKHHFAKRNEYIRNIPHFWVTAIMNHPDISTLFSGHEEEDCLHHLTNIEVEDFNQEDMRSGYYIKFFFDENPYFENSVLSKEYHLGTDSPYSKSSHIIWKEGVQLGQTTLDPNCKTTRKRKLESLKYSFFSWFNDNVDPFTDDIAEDFKGDLWLNPLQYFLVADGQEEETVAEGEEETSSDDLEDSSFEPENQSGSSSQSTNKY
ncbi:unnamed protein product [Ceutorhynchus assimilis]|uniref:Protein SET n=1 Tax=Ceutorhynchus assimilis TaxID=467358 RepID=A0A9N9MHF4_9CUCU|nr:unnamed protein product [Ceutorhynchus assimilis]